MQPHWRQRPVDAEAAQRLLSDPSLQLDPIVAHLLTARGVRTAEEARDFLAPSIAKVLDPARILGMTRAAKRLADAIERGEPIVLWGDYDVDGVTSTSTLLSFLRDVGIEPRWFIPDRFQHGYGLSRGPLEDFVRQGVRVLVTLDCGIAARDEIAWAQQQGVDVIVIDHHEVPPELPPAYAVVDPLQPGCPSPFKHMAACGLTFHLVGALLRELRARGYFTPTRSEPDVRAYLDLTATGTVADVVPLRGINRILVAEGLRVLNNFGRPGFAALREVSNLEDGTVGAGQLGFQFGPRINAAGRLARADCGVELLTTPELQRAYEVAREVDAFNARRRAIEARMVEEALAQARALGAPDDVRGLVLYSQHWHAGVAGIVASRVVEALWRPTIVVAVDGAIGKGSARSAAGFHMVKGLSECAEDLLGFGGHAHAAGLTVAANRLPRFRERFDRIARAVLRDDDLEPTLWYDLDLRLSEIDDAFIERIERLAPFGQGNPRPVFVARDVVVCGAQRVGRDKSHLRLRVAQNGTQLPAIAFGLGELDVAEGDRVDVAFHATFNVFRGKRTAQLRVKHLRPAR